MKKSKKTSINSTLNRPAKSSSTLIPTLVQQALALHQSGKVEAAEQRYRQILAIEPNHAVVLGLLGAACLQQNQLEEALQWLDKAISINPHDANFYSNRGITLRRLNQYQAAIESYQKALAIEPQHADAQNNLGNIGREFYQAGIIAFQKKEYHQALNHFNNALILNPSMAECYNERGNLFYILEHYTHAITDFRRALELNPHLPWAYGSYLHAKALVCQWDNWDTEIKDLSNRIAHGEKVSNCFSFVSLCDSNFLQHKVVEIRVKNNHPLRNELGNIPLRPATSKIRIAYFSTDFHEHAVAHVIAELFELHDRQRFEVIAFSLGEDKNDSMRQRLVKAFDHFIDVRHYSDQEIAQLSRNMDVDIAIDLNGFTAGNRFNIFTYRAAPIQVSYIGYPGTSGSSCIDYIIADNILIPANQQIYFSEKIIYLPHSYQVNDRQRKIADRNFTRAELGLPSSGFIFCCFNNNYKIMPSTFEGWMRILHKVPSSVLWLLADSSYSENNLRQYAISCGIDSSRLIFFQRMPLAQYLAAQRVADLFLDTFPYNAHATGSGALWAGLPVLTCMGESFASRVGASLLNAIEIPELITTNQAEYEAKAVELALNPEKMKLVREKLHNNRLVKPLFNTPLFTHDLENAYEQMMQRYRVGLLPDHIQVHKTFSLSASLKQAIFLHQSGQLEDAKKYYFHILKIQPNNAVVLGLLGSLFAQQGQSENALQYLNQSIAINPYDANIHSNRGIVLRRLNRYPEALESYDRALKINPLNSDAYSNRSYVFQKLNRYEEALESCDLAIQINPNFIDAYINRGNALIELKKYHLAIESFNFALKINPNFAQTYNALGTVFYELQQYQDAIAYYSKAIALNKNYQEAYYNRGLALAKQKKYEDSIRDYDRSIAIDPDHVKSYYNKALLLSELKLYQSASESYEKVIALNSNFEFAQSDYLHIKAKICNWNSFDSKLNNLIQSIRCYNTLHSSLPILALLDYLSLHLQVAQIYVDKKYPFNHELGLIPQRSASGQSSKIRIGYFSSDFHGKHPVANVIAELFELHDKSRFEIIAFSFGVDTQDALRQRIVNAFDQFIDVRTYTDKEVAQLARTMEIDIAVDLNGFTADNRFGIFAYRAAPIQVCYLGYPGTVGAEYMDYLIADPTVIPEESRIYYSGKIAYLPHCYQVNDRKRVISDRIFTRAELGLPDSGFVFCCFNNNYKIIPSVFDSWMKILHQVPNSVLWLVRDNDTAADNLLKEAQQRGIDATRIIFAQRVPLTEDYLARNRMADLFLDTLPYNAHSTASDALWAGLPVLTRMGESFASRVAGSLLNAIGLPELITTTAEEFEAKAVDLALNPEKLQAIREKLHRNRLTTPLFDSELFTRHLENAYTQMVQRYHCGLSPDHLVIPALNP